MIASILGSIQTLVNLLFLVVVLGTAALSWWLSTKYRQRHAEFPWPRACIILAIEILVWICFNIFWSFFVQNWLIVCIVVVIVIFVIVRRKKNDVI